MVHALSIGMLFLTSLGPRSDDAVQRTLEADFRQLNGKWVLKDLPAGWTSVELNIAVEGKNLSLELNSHNQWASSTSAMSGVQLRERDGRRSINHGNMVVDYAFWSGALVFREREPRRAWGSITDGLVRISVPTLDGEWVRERK